ncbi:hypothetical protein BDY19DRAFT_289863 [Irpex rosettiformis]|uniref:Uncharacterized protein n=1 Tax=Irpex rosettiformis TaxID=378272 RepID=A0ACB8UHR8_9APHY|nr:hypothetical protein BDY19DRAFT_289863 [Irpex rosettiformis]
MPLASKLLCRVKSSENIGPTPNQKMAPDRPGKVVEKFISEDPNSEYTFDSERDAPQSELCREGKELSRKCIQIQMHSTKLFKTMQDQGFFCALPQNPAQTYIKCERIPK